jgi:hypothetical protein
MATDQLQLTNSEFLLEIDDALEDSGLPINKLNQLMRLAEERLRCDTECQRKKDIAALKEKWLTSKSEYNKLPDEIVENEKNYYTLDKGEKYYKNNILKTRYDDHIKKYKNAERAKLTDVKSVLDALTANYKSDTVAESRIDQLYEDVSKKNQALKLDVDNYYKKTFTDERKVFYEDQEIDNLKYYRTIITIAYYVLIVFYIVFGSFFAKGDYKKWKSWLLIVVYIAIPYLLKNIINGILSVYDNYL